LDVGFGGLMKDMEGQLASMGKQIETIANEERRLAHIAADHVRISHYHHYLMTTRVTCLSMYDL
jgi:hypothetical protein